MSPSYFHSIRLILRSMVDGVCDSLRLTSTFTFFLSSVTVRVRAAQCFILNGVIFLGSILLADFILAPALRSLLTLGGINSTLPSTSMPLASSSIPLPSGEEGHNVGEWLNVVLLYAYQLLWIYPLYAISFILNAIWYQDIADHAFITRGGTYQGGSITFQKWVATMSDEVYRLLLVTAYMIQITLVSFIPFGIGYALVVLHLCWMYSLYSFEYKWSLLGWSLEYRLKYFERHWAYFLGFGLPAVLVSLVFPKFISLGFFALSFPFFIILAITAKPTSHVKKEKKVDGVEKVKGKETGKVIESSSHSSSDGVLLPQLPIFRFATWINWWILKQLQRRTQAASRRPSIQATTIKTNSTQMDAAKS